MNTLIFTKKKFKLHLKANKICKKIKIMLAFRQMSQKNTNLKQKFVNVLIYSIIKQPIIYLIFSAYAALILFFFYLSIYPPDSQESDGGVIHRVSNYPDLLPEMPRYCCPLVI